MKLWISCVAYSNCSTRIMCVFTYPEVFLHCFFSLPTVMVWYLVVEAFNGVNLLYLNLKMHLVGIARTEPCVQ